MRQRAQASMWLLAAFAILIFSPNLTLLYRDPGIIPLVRGILVSGILFAAVLAIFRQRLWVACLIFLPFAVLAPAEVLYILRYDRTSDANIVATIFESNLRETSEYLGPVKTYLLTAFGLAAILSLSTVWMLWKSKLAWRHRSAYWTMAIAAGIPLLTILIALVHKTPHASMGDRVSTALDKLRLETYATYPFGVVDRYLNYRQEWREMQDASETLVGYQFGAYAKGHIDVRQIYVLVIGEASRRDHWSLFGYERPTNPELSRTENLVMLPDMVTPWSASRLAVPTIVTRKPAEDADMYFNEPSISRVFKEAGFQTYWYSSQQAIGPFDSPISVAAFDAMHVKFLNPAGYADEDMHDDALLSPLKEAIDSSQDNLFIVLHTLGSHQDYTGRYPASFERFVPAPDAGKKYASYAEYRNAYDNSVLFTDHFLKLVIDILRRSHAISSLLYVSDHGEMLPDASCTITGHGFPGLPVYTVPALFWYSSEYAGRFGEKLTALKANASYPITTGNVFETLVDMADLDFSGHDTRRSLFNTGFEPQRRIVHTDDAVVDFDHKRVLPKCQVVAPAPAAP